MKFIPPIGCGPMATAGDFGKEVAEEYRSIRKTVEGRPIKTSGAPGASSTSHIDREVREQILSDLDGLIRRHTA